MAEIRTSIGTKSNVQVYEFLDEKLNELFDVLPDIETKCLNVGAYIIKDAMKRELVAKMPAAGRPFKVKISKSGKQNYITSSEPMSEGIRQSSKRGNSVAISARGGDAHTSGYLVRMYEHDSKPRKQKSTGRKLGKLTGVHYFQTGQQVGIPEAFEAMQRVYENKINTIINN